LEQAYTNTGGQGSVQSKAVQELADEGKTLNTGSAQEQTTFNNLLQQAYTAVETMSASATSPANQTEVMKAWCRSVYGSSTDIINKDLGLWYDASAGNIKYLGGDGQPLNLVSGDATGYMKGMVTSSSDVSACVEAFGADSWLSDASPYGEGANSSTANWARSVYGSTKDVYNQNLGLWYDASAGNIKYLDSNGKTTNYVSGDATGYMKGMVTSSSDVSACVEAFGADSWLSDSSSDSSSGTGHTAGSIGEGPKGSGSVIGSGSGRNGSGSNSDTTQTKIVPEVTNTTGSNQIKSTFDLTVTTNRSAACQYKQGNTFDYGAGNTFDTTGNTNHSAKLYSLTTGNYTYYVVCKDTATGGVSNALAIAIKVDLALDENNKPIVSNNTSANFTNSTVTLAVNTDRPAKCEYKNK